MSKMKKVICMTIAVIGVCGSISLSNKEQWETANDLVLENVEALADGESGVPICFGTGSLVCPATRQNVKIVRIRSIVRGNE